MLKSHSLHRLATVAAALALAIAPACLQADTFTQTDLVSDVSGLAANTDPNLKNPWGVSFSATSPFWASDQATGVATLYGATGAPVALVVTIPGSTTGPSGPTGQVFNSSSGFLLTNGNGVKASFIFDSLNGTITGWNGGTTAVVEATGPTGAVYTGLAQGTSAIGSVLYAANSGASPGINVFDSSWHSATLSGSFTDPNLPAGFVPFNVQNLNGNIYVTYAMLNPKGGAMPGGYVDEFDANGVFIKTIASNGAVGPLFAPWGIVFAPPSFGSYSNDLLIGNFGNGEIDVYNPTTDAFLGTLNGNDGVPLVNGALWALETRAPGSGFDPDAVYFTAGINDEADGLFGEITLTPEPATIVETATGVIALAFAGLRRRFSGNSAS
jgi:uncharacterized protein (TIGR03118 family)